MGDLHVLSCELREKTADLFIEFWIHDIMKDARSITENEL